MSKMYHDKHGVPVMEGAHIRFDDGSVEEVIALENDDLGINASNPAYLATHPEAWPEGYPLSQFNEKEFEVILHG